MTAEGQRAGSRKRREVLTHQVYRCQDRSSSLVNRSRGSVPSSNYCKRAACQNNLVKSEFPKTLRTRRVEKISPLDSRESFHVRNQKLNKPRQSTLPAKKPRPGPFFRGFHHGGRLVSPHTLLLIVFTIKYIYS